MLSTDHLDDSRVVQCVIRATECHVGILPNLCWGYDLPPVRMKLKPKFEESFAADCKAARIVVADEVWKMFSQHRIDDAG